MTHYATSVKRKKWLEKIYGNCLEKAGIVIPNRGCAIVDKRFPVKVGDIVVCSEIAGQIPPYLKRVIEVNENSVIVGTAYMDSSKDFQFEAEEIIGTVVEI